MNGLRPVIVALIFVGGVKVTRNALLIGGVLAVSAVDFISAGLFASCFFILQKWKPSPVAVILVAGTAGGVIRLLLGM